MYHPPPIPQTNVVQAAAKKEKGPIDLGTFGCLLFLPLLFLAAMLSFPYGLVANLVHAHNERQFRKKLRKAGRAIEWPEFVQALNTGHGTVIIETYFPKGPERWWWTEENVCSLSPSPMADAREIELGADFENDPVGDWCFEQYVSTSTGKALLVGGSREGRKSFNELSKSVRIITLNRHHLGRRKNLGKKA
jgi:hypothetical protein